MEDDSGLTDPRRPVDQRHLAEERGPLVASELGADELRAAVRLDLDDPTRREPEPQALDGARRQDQRLGDPDRCPRSAASRAS